VVFGDLVINTTGEGVGRAPSPLEIGFPTKRGRAGALPLEKLVHRTGGKMCPSSVFIVTPPKETFSKLAILDESWHRLLAFSVNRIPGD
jgi:hypothetical protein